MTHAPHWLVSQPMCVPVSPRLSRRKLTNSNRGSTSAAYSTPLTCIRTATRPGAAMVVAIVFPLLCSLTAGALPPGEIVPIAYALQPNVSQTDPKGWQVLAAKGTPEPGSDATLKRRPTTSGTNKITWAAVYRRAGGLSSDQNRPGRSSYKESCHELARMLCGGFSCRGSPDARQSLAVLPVIEFLESGVSMPDGLPPTRVGHIPVDGVVQRLMPVTTRSPTQFSSDTGGIDAVAPIMTRPVLDVPDQRTWFADSLKDGVHHLQV